MVTAWSRSEPSSTGITHDAQLSSRLRPPVPGEAVIIDLTSSTFVEVYPLVAVACMMQDSVSRGLETIVKPPRIQNVANYLSRMDFDRFIGAHCPEVTGCSLPSVRHADRRDAMVEMQWFGAGDNLTALEELLFARLDGRVPAQVLAALIESFWEIGENARYHSGATGGVVAAQVYRRGSADERMDLAIGDAGMGIRASLYNSGRYDPPDDGAAIELALEYQVTSTDDPGRGVGLPTTAEAVVGLKGTMTVRTCAASRRLTPSSTRAPLCRESIQGTVVGVSIPCR